MNDFLSLVSKVFLGGLAYVIVSNTFWLLFGSRVIQFLPGVKNDTSFKETLRISIMILSAIIGSIIYLLKRVLFFKTSLKKEISKMIKMSSRVFKKRL